jgi:hypothetical protein
MKKSIWVEAELGGLAGAGQGGVLCTLFPPHPCSCPDPLLLYLLLRGGIKTSVI